MLAGSHYVKPTVINTVITTTKFTHKKYIITVMMMIVMITSMIKTNMDMGLTAEVEDRMIV